MTREPNTHKTGTDLAAVVDGGRQELGEETRVLVGRLGGGDDVLEEVVGLLQLVVEEQVGLRTAHRTGRGEGIESGE